MGVELAGNRYGKSRVRVMRVDRSAAQHEVAEWNVEVLVSGDFETAHTEGDNSKVLPTDTMKNTVYYVARKSNAATMEAYAQELAEFLLSRNPQIHGVEVTVQSTPWKRLTVDGKLHPDAFMKGSEERQMTTVSRRQGEASVVRQGLHDLTVLKTSKSGFVGYVQDELTTLPPTTDRLFCTAVTANWLLTDDVKDFGAIRRTVRESMIAAFAKHDSLSVQQTLYAMAEAALEAAQQVVELTLRMPNKHCLLVDMSRFGLDNPNHIFVPTDEPHGTIEATVRRTADAAK